MAIKSRSRKPTPEVVEIEVRVSWTVEKTIKATSYDDLAKKQKEITTKLKSQFEQVVMNDDDDAVFDRDEDDDDTDESEQELDFD